MLAMLPSELHYTIGTFVGLGYFALQSCSRRLNVELSCAEELRHELRPDRVNEMYATPVRKRRSGEIRPHWEPTQSRAFAVAQFHWACIRGYLPLAQWLAYRYKLTVKHARIESLHDACANGHLSTAQWLATHFGLTPADIKASLAVTCMYGHLTTAEWLAGHFKLTPKDARIANNLALRMACMGGHLKAAQWLVAHFGLTVEDIIGVTSENTAIKAWLVDLRRVR
jgi:hypothetical protein